MQIPDKKLKEILKERGISPITIANELGLRRWTVYQVINNRSGSKRVIEAIARRLGMTIDQVKELLPPKAA